MNVKVMSSAMPSKDQSILTLKTSSLEILIAMLSMIAAVALSNYWVQFEINEWLTWGAFTYPLTFFITELTNRFHGPRSARLVVYAGFVVALGLSTLLANPRIATASASAFLLGQLLDI